MLAVFRFGGYYGACRLVVVAQEVFRWSAGIAGGTFAVSALLCSGERFQGKKGRMSSGALPPAAAHFSRNACSQVRGFHPHICTVAMIENIMAARRPLHSAAEP